MNIPWKPVLALLAIVGLCLLALAYCDARKDAKEASSRATVAQSQAKLGEDAADITAGVVAAQNDLDDLERQNREDILDAENASQDAGDAGNRGLRALCRRVSYQSDPRCIGLR